MRRPRVSLDRAVLAVLVGAVLLLIGAGIGMPLLATAFRASVVEIPVALWGADDLRVGGRKVLVGGATPRIDGAAAAWGQEAGGVTADRAEGRITVRVAVVRSGGGDRRLDPPIVVQVPDPRDDRGNHLRLIDGAPLTGDAWQRVVVRQVGVGHLLAYAQAQRLERVLGWLLPAGVVLAAIGLLRRWRPGPLARALDAHGSLLATGASLGLFFVDRWAGRADGALGNSVFVATATTLVVLPVAFLYAWALARTRLPCRGLFMAIALIPLAAPSMLFGLALVILFGNQGIITTGATWGATADAATRPWWAVDLHLYGANGVVLAEIAACFPAAVLILRAALADADDRMYDAARTLGLGRWRTFWSVTVPAVRPAMVAVAAAVATMAMTDFGAAKVVGGNDAFLAVDIFKQVVGQQDLSMGAAVALWLLLPAVAAAIIERLAARRQAAAMTSGAVPWSAPVDRLRDVLAGLVVVPVAVVILTLVGATLAATLAERYPYDWSPTLRHYAFTEVIGCREALTTSLSVAALAGVVGAPLALIGAWLVLRAPLPAWLAGVIHGGSILPLALPGLTLGIGTILACNPATLPPPFQGIANPLHGLYGTLALLVFHVIAHHLSVAYLTAVAAVQQLDRQFEAAAATLGRPTWQVLATVTIPCSLPTLIDIGAYLFVAATTTVSGVIFLCDADHRMASVLVCSLDDAGDTAAAAALCLVIVVINVAVRAVATGIGWLITARVQRWRRPGDRSVVK